MSKSERLWREDAAKNGWKMPAFPRWQRLPIIRRMVALIFAIKVARHDDAWRRLGFVPRKYDTWVIFGLANGLDV